MVKWLWIIVIGIFILSIPFINFFLLNLDDKKIKKDLKDDSLKEKILIESNNSEVNNFSDNSFSDINDSNSKIISSQKDCEKSGGIWREFINYGDFCHDECNKPENYFCVKKNNYGCDCGVDKCWNKTQCLLDSDKEK